MQSTTRSPRTRGLWSKWPATTVSTLAGVTALTLLVATRSPAVEETAIVEEAMTDAEASPAVVARLPAAEEATPAAEEAKPAAVPGSKAKSGLYAMKGPKGAPAESAGDFLASPYGGAFAVGSDDSDVWGGLKGTEIGEAYGVGGLGLVGTGRGGGGVEGYAKRGRGAPVADRPVSYDRALQSRVLTVGTVDDNADAKAYQKALARLGASQGLLGIDPALWKMAPPQERHVALPGALDVALVIDTTGSMGDELEYLKVELRDIAEQVSRSYPGVTQRWGLVVYRDSGDDYVTRTVDFRDIDSFVDKLGQQQAGGGGDTPEAMDLAMDASARLSWRTGKDTARMVFLVADAPSHGGAAARRFASAVLEHRTANTAIYPVGASGVDSDAEAQLRLAAKVTGGQYIFLTDHSGVGGHHEAAKVEQFKVETLHDAMARMIHGELGLVAARPLQRASGAPMPILSPVVDIDRLVQVEAPAPGVLEQLRALFASHAMFALGMVLMVLAGMGFDTLIHRMRTR